MTTAARHARRTGLRAGLLATLIALFVGFITVAPSGSAATTWADPSSATVYPSMQLYTGGAQCTANFVYTDSVGNVYIGQAAHCSSTGGQTDTDGCSTGSLPIGTEVDDVNGNRVGTLAYNSWLAMHSAHESDANTCAANDLALVKVDPALVAQTSPTVPGLGGPAGLNTTGVSAASQVYAVGNSSLLFGAGSFVSQTGVVEGSTYGGWAWFVSMVRPGVPGDSGSGYLDSSGRVLGQLSTISVGTSGVGNTVGNLSRELTYANGHGMAGVAVANGQTAFKGVAGMVTILG